MVGNMEVVAIRTHDAGLYIVGAEDLHIVADLLPDGTVQDGAGDLHPVLRVSGHEIRRADINLGLGSRAEDKDARVLQIPPHDGENLDAVRLTGDAGAEAADATDVHDDIHARLTGLGELVDEFPVRDGVTFDEDAGGLPCLCPADLPI